jgi:hypothetical protein
MKAKSISSIVFLIIFSFESFWPTLAMALTESAVQPEFGSYEENGTTDMVNIATGDFTYNIPILNVPSPEGGFSMPLSYHAGIEMDKESSWVGLGWSLNPGVMNRFPSIYPDDYFGNENIYKTVNAPSYNSFRYSETYDGIFFHSNTSYDSNKGYSHSYSYNNGISEVSWGSETGLEVTSLGVSHNFKTGQTEFNAEKGAEQMIFALNVALDPIGTGIGVAASSIVSNATYKTGTNSSKFGNTNVAVQRYRTGLLKQKKGVKQNISVYGNQTEIPEGALYLQNYNKVNPYQSPNNMFIYNGNSSSSPSTTLKTIKKTGYNLAGWARLHTQNNDINPGLFHDMYTFIDNNVQYRDQIQPNNIAYDNYSIRAGGASGQITPQRLDAGSLSNPTYNQYTNNNLIFDGYKHDCYEITAFKDYKVPFRYKNEMSNYYDHLNTGGSKVKIDFGANTQPKFYLNHTSIMNDDPSPNFRITTEPNRSDNTLKNNKLVHGTNINWYSNQEITNSNTIDFMDCGINRTSFPTKGIGGFAITREDGLTYHFSLPVYNKTEERKIKQLNYSQSASTTMNDFFYDKNWNPFATMWLLTGITGADFIDRGVIGKIDDSDWGYWVKLDYGMYNNNYLWRDPYNGWNTSTDGKTSEYSKGYKQTYYLNTIRTRTHTAFFAKSVKKDGVSFYESDGDGRENQSNINETTDPLPAIGSRSLKLDDIYVLKNEDYDDIVLNDINKWNFNYNNGGNFSWAWNWNSNPVTFNINDISTNVILSSDLLSSSSALYKVQYNQLTRINFNYSYDLCDKTSNSMPETATYQYYYMDGFAPNTINRPGKLTLESVNFYGKNNVIVSPNYLFDYHKTNSSENPDYDPNKQDEMGFYKSAGLKNPGPEGSQWSLKEILTPMGGKTKIDYERDTYYHVNGNDGQSFPLKIPVMNVAANIGTNKLYCKTGYGNLNDFVISGNTGYIKSPAYWITPNILPQYVPSHTLNIIVTSVAVNGTFFNFNCTNLSGTALTNALVDIAACPSADKSELGLVTGWNNPKYGGDIRVKQITLSDEFGNDYVTKYKYYNSGVVSKEPQSNMLHDLEEYRYFDHPVTSVIYGNVDVEQGKINGVTFESLGTKNYRFTTPNHTFLNVDKGLAYNNINIANNDFTLNAFNTAHNSHNFSSSNIVETEYRRSAHIIITDNTSRIGSIEEVRDLNNKNELNSFTKFNYTNLTQGNKYSETNFLCEEFVDPSSKLTSALNHTLLNVWRFYQTTRTEVCSKLSSIEKNDGGIQSKETFLEYDLHTGKPIKTKTEIGGSNGEKYITEILPAYQKYPEMGSKVIDPKNKNMMAQQAQVKNYVYVPGSTANNGYQLLGTNVTTWNNNHNYRLFDQTTNKFVSSTLNPINNFILPYLPKSSYVWKSTVDNDGTINSGSFVDYNFNSSSQDPHWQKTGEAKLYSKFSKVLESEDIASKPSSSKLYQNGSYLIASVGNCSHNEWCFSGAEDLVSGNESPYFGGEVEGTQFRCSLLNGPTHTGNYALKVPNATNGFIFKGTFGPTGDFKPNKTYRASVWIHQSNCANAQLFYKIQGTSFSQGTVINTSSTKQKYGDWYLLNLDILLPAYNSSMGANPTIQFVCENASSASATANFVFMDDFRVQPLATSLVANVIDVKTGNLLAKLDEENFGTKFVYDSRNKLKETYKEAKNGFVKISEHQYNFKR